MKMFNFLNDIGNYESRKVGNTKVDSLYVSTAYTSDEGYETAIIDVDGEVHPVERYDSKEEAIKGHDIWCEKAKTIKEVTKLGGWDGLIDDEIITIKR